MHVHYNSAIVLLIIGAGDGHDSNAILIISFYWTLHIPQPYSISVHQFLNYEHIKALKNLVRNVFEHMQMCL